MSKCSQDAQLFLRAAKTIVEYCDYGHDEKKENTYCCDALHGVRGQHLAYNFGFYFKPEVLEGWLGWWPDPPSTADEVCAASRRTQEQRRIALCLAAAMADTGDL